MISIRYLILMLLGQTALATDITPLFKVDMFPERIFIPKKNEVKTWTPIAPNNTEWDGGEKFFLNLINANTEDLFNRAKNNEQDVKKADDTARNLGKIFSIKSEESKPSKEVVANDKSIPYKEPYRVPGKHLIDYEFNVDVLKLRAVATAKTEYFEIRNELNKTDLTSGIYIGNLQILHRYVDTYESLGFTKSF